MASKNIPFIIHPAKGGLDNTKAPTLLEPDQLAIALNIEYDTSGARRKRLGTTRYNATQLTEGGAALTFTALSDFWRHGTSLSPTQKFVATAGTQIWKSDQDGIWDSIVTSWGTNTARTHITIAQGFSVFSNSNNNRPQKWDQTTATDLSVTDMRFEACVYHQRRLYTVGEQTAATGSANPSRATFTAAGDITDLTGADTGLLIFDEDDGDRLVGVSKPFHNRLYFFKGPNVGSIHEMTGTSSSGAGAYARNKIHSGIPCVNHSGIVTTANDIYWPSHFGIHSLSATQKYGDTEETFLSRPIQATYRGLNFARLGQIVGFSHPTRNIVGWAVPDSGQTENTLVLVYNTALGLWSIWDYTGFNIASVMVALRDQVTLGIPTLYLGGYGGYAYIGDRTILSDENADQAYTARIRTPVYMKFGDAAHEVQEKSFASVTTFFRPKGDYNATLTINVDRRNQTANVSMAGGADTLG